ncbi:MAG: metallophosphoesterase [Lachnospiraceae bacterium]|nr:metallophosphoesterase [Lachnospiraceae bacterium]
MDILTLVIFILIFIVILLIGVMIYDGNRFVVENYEIKDERVLNETKFVFLTDLHNKQYGTGNVRLIDEVKKLKPDMILIGGDLYIAKPGKSTDVASDLISKLKEIAPVCYGMGNHEYRSSIYTENYGSMYEDYANKLATLGVKILNNEFTDFNEFRIYGLSIDRAYYKRFVNIYMDESYIPSIIKKPENDKINIFLAHNPDYFENYVKAGAKLSLSGHVHGGVARLPFVGGLFSPKITLFPIYDGGEYKINDSSMIVSRGLGVHTIPFRLFNPAEISVITFKK